MTLKQKIARYRRKKILEFLRTTQPGKFENAGRKRLISTVERAMKSSPAYASLAAQHGIVLSSLKRPEDFFGSIPITNKQNYFAKYNYNELVGKNLSKVKLAMSSSGYSGTFAFGFSTEDALKNGRAGADITLAYWFDISNRTTFLINCAPMGVHVETSLPIAEVSVRSDMAIALLQKVSPAYEQTILAGDPYFLKKIVEEGNRANIDWVKLNVSLITAQDWLPESLRTYLAYCIHLDLNNTGSRGIYATMGMTELGLNVFHESKYTVALRRKILNNQELKQAFIPTDMTAPPCLFHYYPFRTVIESITGENGIELVFTVVDDKNILPVIRYSTGDAGRIRSYTELEQILKPSGYQHLLPDLKLPLGIMCGRSANKFEFQGKNFYLEDIKEALFNNHKLAPALSGMLHIRNLAKTPYIVLHLNKDYNSDKQLQKMATEAIQEFLHLPFEVELAEYHQLPNALELNYERKLYLRPDN